MIVSPYAKPGYVTSTVYDHTSVLKLIERKWNLPPLTRRDAAANDPLDALDLERPPSFLTPPSLPGPGITAQAVASTIARLAAEAERPVFTAAEEDAMAWAITTMPPLRLGPRQVRQLRKAGIAPSSSLGRI